MRCCRNLKEKAKKNYIKMSFKDREVNTESQISIVSDHCKEWKMGVTMRQEICNPTFKPCTKITDFKKA